MAKFTLADLPAGHKFYGVELYNIGEDSEWLIAFDYVEPLRMIAACNRFAREVCGLQDLFDGAFSREPIVDSVYTKPVAIRPEEGGSFYVSWDRNEPNRDFLATFMDWYL